MDRKDFLKKSGCGMFCFTAAPLLLHGADAQGAAKAQERKRFKIDIEIYEAREDSWCHKKGDKYEYPADMDKLCPWLLASMHDFISLLQHDVTLGWKYEGTPYEKVLNENGITTEFVRCPDPTGDLVAKIIRTEV